MNQLNENTDAAGSLSALVASLLDPSSPLDEAWGARTVRLGAAMAAASEHDRCMVEAHTARQLGGASGREGTRRAARVLGAWRSDRAHALLRHVIPQLDIARGLDDVLYEIIERWGDGDVIEQARDLLTRWPRHDPQVEDNFARLVRLDTAAEHAFRRHRQRTAARDQLLALIDQVERGAIAKETIEQACAVLRASLIEPHARAFVAVTLMDERTPSLKTLAALLLMGRMPASSESLPLLRSLLERPLPYHLVAIAACALDEAVEAGVITPAMAQEALDPSLRRAASSDPEALIGWAAPRIDRLWWAPSWMAIARDDRARDRARALCLDALAKLTARHGAETVASLLGHDPRSWRHECQTLHDRARHDDVIMATRELLRRLR